MSKFLDYYGLSYFWEQIDRIKQDKLTIDTELDATSHNPVENMAIKFAIDQLAKSIIEGNPEGTAMYPLLEKITTYGGNSYFSTAYCVRNGAVVTLYFDIELEDENNTYWIADLIPEGNRPFKQIQYIVPESSYNFNTIIVNEDGQIGITSINGKYSVHGAVTYVIVTDSTVPPVDPDEAKYSVVAKMIKIGNYLPTYSSNKLDGIYPVLGGALTTDLQGEQFSGSQGNYVPYIDSSAGLSDAVRTFNSVKFYWNKINENQLNGSGNGYLYSFDDCFEEYTDNETVTNEDLIQRGLSIISNLAVENNEIQYFVTNFGIEPWIGGVTYNSKIANKAYGGTSDAGTYNGRIYWTRAVLAHLYRFIPQSVIESEGIDISGVDESYIIRRNDEIIGYVDKVIKIGYEDKAYTWGNFSNIAGGTWRGIKLMSTSKTETTLSEPFSGRLFIEDWNEHMTSGNIRTYPTNYYQRILASIDEENNTIEVSSLRYRNYAHGQLLSSWKDNTEDELIKYTGPELQ